MKKVFALMMVLALCLPLCACDKEEPQVGKGQDMIKNETVMITDPVETVPISTEPQIVEIEITLDNWQEYFEFKEYLFFQNGDFGDFKQYSFHWCFIPKEEIGTVKKCTVALGYDYHVENHYFTVDPDAKTYEWGEVALNPYAESGSDTEKVGWLDMVRLYSDGAIDIRGAQLRHMFGNTLTSGNAPYYTFEITRIEGTLTVEKNN